MKQIVIDENGKECLTSKAGDKTYEHVQSMPATQWLINHKMGKNPSITVYDGYGNLIITDIEHTDLDNSIVNNQYLMVGKAICN